MMTDTCIIRSKIVEVVSISLLTHCSNNSIL